MAELRTLMEMADAEQAINRVAYKLACSVIDEGLECDVEIVACLVAASTLLQASIDKGMSPFDVRRLAAGFRHGAALADLAASKLDGGPTSSTAVAAAYRHAAILARNCTHSCVSEKHCDFLHAAHERLAKELEECAARAEAAAEEAA